MNTKLLKSIIQNKKDDQHIPPIGGTLFAIFLVVAITGAVIGDGRYSDGVIGGWVLGWTIVGTYFLFALKVASQWEKVIVLRLGRFNGLKGPGLFWIIPIIDTAVMWVDHRVAVTSFSAEKTLTKDTVPVDVDAVLFWVVWDAEKAALEVTDYNAAISRAAQTALREIIGQMTLADILVGRAKMARNCKRSLTSALRPGV